MTDILLPVKTQTSWVMTDILLPV